jgi:hypothetical protein
MGKDKIEKIICKGMDGKCKELNAILSIGYIVDLGDYVNVKCVRIVKHDKCYCGELPYDKKKGKEYLKSMTYKCPFVED